MFWAHWLYSSVSAHDARLYKRVLRDKLDGFCRVYHCLELRVDALCAFVSGNGPGQTLRFVFGAEMRNAARVVFGQYPVFSAHRLPQELHGQYDVRTAMRHDVSEWSAVGAGDIFMCDDGLSDDLQLIMLS